MKNRMNIGIFTDTYYPQISGVDTSIKILRRGLDALGHRTIIFTTTDPGAKAPETDAFRLPSVPFLFLPSRRIAFTVPPRLLTRLKDLKLDIIHTHTEFSMGYFGKLAAGILGVPMLHTYHTIYENYTHYVAGGRVVTPSFARAYSRTFCNGATAITTPTEKTRELLLQYGVRKPVHTIPTGIEFDKFKRGLYSPEDIQKTRAELGVAPDELMLVTIGRVAKEKGMDAIIKAMPQIKSSLPRVKYVSIGDGPYVSELKTLANGLGVADSVIFAGPRPWSEIGKYYQSGDVFVSGSTSETQGIVYIEAMASQVPLIVKRDKSLDEILLDGETGLLFDTPAELARHAVNLLTDAGMRKHLSDNAYAFIQPLSADIFAQRMASLYQELINQTPARRKRIKLPLPVRRRR